MSDRHLHSGINQFPCCTANYHQGWPKLANAIFGTNVSTVGFEGIVVLLWAPAAANTSYGEITVDTEYPFGDTATVTVVADPDQNATRDSIRGGGGGGGAAGGGYLYLRVPGWASEAEIVPQWSGAERVVSTAAAMINGTIQRLRLPGGARGAKAVVQMNFRPSIRLEADGLSSAEPPDTRGSISWSVHRGALMYSLPLHLKYRQTAHYFAESNDYDVTPTSPWAWALDVGDGNPANVSAAMTFAGTGWATGSAPFNKTSDPAGVGGSFWPAKIMASARDVSAVWRLQPGVGDGRSSEGWCPHVPPASPVCAGGSAAGSGGSKCGPSTKVMLVPHGGTALRVGTFPLSGLQSSLAV